MDELLTLKEVAKRLKLKPQTVYSWTQKGELPGFKIGKEWRFKLSAIEKWIDQKAAGA